jgi:hypothetical protein
MGLLNVIADEFRMLLPLNPLNGIELKISILSSLLQTGIKERRSQVQCVTVDHTTSTGQSSSAKGID